MQEQATIKMPNHVAIIMDGSGRWAQERGLPRNKGHDAGSKAVRNAINFALDHHIKSLSLYAFSIENWKRPQEEVQHLMGLFAQALADNRKYFKLYRVQLNVIGDISGLDPKLAADLQRAIKETAKYDRLKLNIALNYSGQWDITQGCQQLNQQLLADLTAALVQQAQQAGSDSLPISSIVNTIDSFTNTIAQTQQVQQQLEKYLCVTDQDPIDLIIRTSNEQRLSNFFLWQAAYSEFVFLKEYWPEFDSNLFMQAIIEFNKRQRRFGSL